MGDRVRRILFSRNLLPHQFPDIRENLTGDNIGRCFAAIAYSNGWSPTTAALQLFAHLDGEAFNVALRMPVEERERWTTFLRGLSDYFNSPGRLAPVRRRFESAIRRPGVDPATFATELGILRCRVLITWVNAPVAS